MKITKKIITIGTLCLSNLALAEDVIVASNVNEDSNTPQKSYSANSSSYEEKYFSGREYVLSQQEKNSS